MYSSPIHPYTRNGIFILSTPYTGHWSSLSHHTPTHETGPPSHQTPTWETGSPSHQPPTQENGPPSHQHRRQETGPTSSNQPLHRKLDLSILHSYPGYGISLPTIPVTGILISLPSIPFTGNLISSHPPIHTKLDHHTIHPYTENWTLPPINPRKPDPPPINTVHRKLDLPPMYPYTMYPYLPIIHPLNRKLPPTLALHMNLITRVRPVNVDGLFNTTHCSSSTLFGCGVT